MKRFLKALGTGAGTALLVAAGLFALAYGIRQIDPVLDQIHLAPLLLRFLSPEMIGAWSLFAAVFAALSVMLERHRLVRLLVFGFLLIGIGQRVLPRWTAIAEDELRQQVRQTAMMEAQAQVDTLDAQVFEYSGLPTIRFVQTEPVSQEEADRFADTVVRALPSFLLERCTSIILMEDTFFFQEEPAKNHENMIGYANSADMAVRILRSDLTGPYIDLSMPDRVLQPQDYYIHALAHELSHIFDYQWAYNEVFLSDSPAFQSLYAAEGRSLNDYASTSAAEFFAEASKYYLLYPDELLEKAPQTFQYFQNLYGEGTQ
ncbi:zinc-dependent peptidase [uncultured Dubosiella sp.]|uniref:zinc-dependent peptidase n=2 Tax=uncultured Dubosiella sp. TaxID=1937011 RepID=UPI00272FAC53|nr:zinc-dependent peptidase [uncultured Dubosiella sp.]